MNRLKLSKEEMLRLALMEADCPSIAAGRRLLKAKPKPVTEQKNTELHISKKAASRL